MEEKRRTSGLSKRKMFSQSMVLRELEKEEVHHVEEWGDSRPCLWEALEGHIILKGIRTVLRVGWALSKKEEFTVPVLLF